MFPYEAENCPFNFCEELCWNFSENCIESVDCFSQDGHSHHLYLSMDLIFVQSDRYGSNFVLLHAVHGHLVFLVPFVEDVKSYIITTSRKWNMNFPKSTTMVNIYTGLNNPLGPMKLLYSAIFCSQVLPKDPLMR